MKILITGATGFIGSTLADYCREMGHDILCAVRRQSNTERLEAEAFDIIKVDFSDYKSLIPAVSDIDIIFHAAGATFAKNDDEFMRSNRDATANLLRATGEGCPGLKRFVFVSSQTVSGPSNSLATPLVEDSPPNPLTAYARSKKAAEDAVMSYADSLPITICRAPAVFGPRDTAILDIFKIVNKGFAPQIGFNKKYLNLIYSRDLVRGLYMAALNEKSKGQLYFITSKEIFSWDEIFRAMKKAFGKKRLITLKLPHFLVLFAGLSAEKFGSLFGTTPVFNKEKALDFIQSFWTCSHEKAFRDFGFQSEISLEEALRETVFRYKEAGWLK